MLDRIKRLVVDQNLLYSAGIYVLVLWALGHLFWRGLNYPPYLRRWGERFGFVDAVDGDDVIWVHAVSVGEVRTVARLVDYLKDSYPDHRVLVTTMTPTGSEQVRQLHGDSVLHCYAPYDLPGSVRRFLDRVKPKVAFVIETEFWPNILRLCEERSIPTLLLNVRVSPKSFKGYSLFPNVVRRMLARPTVIAAQSADDADRLLALGAPDGWLTVTGNLKFDVEPPAGIADTVRALRERWGAGRPVWIAASTHDGEEPKVLEAFATLLRDHLDLLLVLVPRHPERFPGVEKLCRREGHTVELHSAGRDPLPADTNVLIGDTMGELVGMYGAADVAFVGGSLVRHGGHNLVEAMAVDTPCVFGPHVFNFEQSSRTAVGYGAAKQVRDPRGLAASISRFLDDPQERSRAAGAARRVIADNQGALRATQAIIMQAAGLPETEQPPASGHGFQ